MTRTDVTSALLPSQTYGLVYSQPVSAASAGVMRSVANQAGYTVASQPVAHGVQSYALAVQDDRAVAVGVLAEGEIVALSVVFIGPLDYDLTMDKGLDFYCFSVMFTGQFGYDLTSDG